MSDYVTQLNEKLVAARKRVKQGAEARALKESAPTLYEIIDGEISLAVNKMTQNEPLSHEQYLSAHGQVVGIRRIRDLLNAKESEEVTSAQEVEAIKDNLERMNNDKTK